MSIASSDPLFTGSIPEIYDRYLVPLIFEPYAADLASRLVEEGSESVLEIAAGTGVVARALVQRLPDHASITATDLNQPMVDHAATLVTSRRVTWRSADAMALPFADATFDTVVCQFGVMFFPDRVKCYSEVRRVLRPGGLFLFNVWDRIETNEFAHVVTDGVATVFPDDPPRFLERTPHGYYDEVLIGADLKAAGFGAPEQFEMLDARSMAANPSIPAIAYCQGTPLRNEIEQRDATAGRYEGSHHGRARPLRAVRGRWPDPRVRRRRQVLLTSRPAQLRVPVGLRNSPTTMTTP